MKKFAIAALIALPFGLISAPALADSVPSPPANPPTWAATISPTSGTDTESPVITTSGACPSPARNVIAKIYGEGFPASGQNVIGNSSGGVSTKNPFQAPLQQSLRDTRNLLPKYEPYQGTYTIVVSCIVPAFDSQSYGNYTVKIKFSNASNWTALPPVSNVAGPVQLPNGQYVPADSAQAQNRNASPSPNPSDPAASAYASAKAAALNGTQAAHASSGSDWGYWLIGGGIAIAALVVFFVFRPKSRA